MLPLTPANTALLQAALLQTPGLQLAYVFGSMANGTARPDSDIDLAVMANHRLSPREVVHLMEAAAQATGRPVDLIDLSVAGTPVLTEVLQKGLRLCGDDTAHAKLASRAAIDANDYYPYVQRLLKQRRQAWIG